LDSISLSEPEADLLRLRLLDLEADFDLVRDLLLLADREPVLLRDLEPDRLRDLDPVLLRDLLPDLLEAAEPDLLLDLDRLLDLSVGD